MKHPSENRGPLRYLISLIALTLLPCAVVWAGGKLKLKVEGKILYPSSGQERTLQTSEEADLDEPALILSEERMPVLVLPHSSSDTVQIDPPLYRATMPKLFQKQMNQSLSDLLIRVDEVQQLIRERKVQAAFDKMRELETQYGKIPFLHFLDASIAMLRGERSEAIRLTQEGLKSYPDYAEGKRFLEQLTRKSSEKPEKSPEKPKKEERAP